VNRTREVAPLILCFSILTMVASAGAQGSIGAIEPGGVMCVAVSRDGVFNASGCP
jgi:hypothetical protein